MLSLGEKSFHLQLPRSWKVLTKHGLEQLPSKSGGIELGQIWAMPSRAWCCAGEERPTRWWLLEKSDWGQGHQEQWELSGSSTWFCLLLAEWISLTNYRTWATYLTFLNLGSLICKRRTMWLISQRGCENYIWEHLQSTRPDAQHIGNVGCM